jgi:GNAT superfamily N-acetyltransferase
MYTTKRFSKELLPDFRYIFEATNKKKFDESFIVKKFDTQCFGAENIGFLAYSESGEPAGYYGIYPILIQCDSLEVLAAQSGDTMTHPDHRNKGLFRELFNKTALLARENGIRFIFGFPNENSFPGFIKFGWNSPFTSNRYCVPVETNIVQKLRKKIDVGIIERKRAKLNQLRIDFKEVLKSAYIPEHPKGCYIKRDELFFKYKSYSDSLIIKLSSGYVWIKPDTGRLNIGDLFPLTKELYKTLLNEIFEFARQMYFTEVLFLVDPKSFQNDFLSSFASYTPSVPLIIYQIDPECMINNNSFFYTYADLDTF